MAARRRARRRMGTAADESPHGLRRDAARLRRDRGPDAAHRHDRNHQVSQLARVEPEDRGSTHLVHIIGEIDLSNAGQIMDDIRESVPSHASHVVLDLSDTQYLDSAGIAMVFRLAERLRYSRQELRLVVPADAPIRAVIELTMMQQIIPIDDAI